MNEHDPVLPADAAREAIVVIHGANPGRKDGTRTRLVECLELVVQSAASRVSGPTAVDGADGVTLDVKATDGARQVDIYEAYWGDLIPSLSRESLRTRVVSGFTMLSYWLFSPAWRGMRNSKVVFLTSVGSTFLLLAWYYGTIALFLAAIDLQSLGAASEPTGATPASLTALLEQLRAIGARLQGWKLWALITVVLGFLPVATMVDLSDFVRHFLSGTGGERAGVRHEIHARVRRTLEAVVGSQRYSGITVVAHSFGSVVAVDVLADYMPPPDVRLRLVTLGGALELLASREPWVAEEIDRVARGSAVAEWVEYYSNEDYFASRTPIEPLPEKCRQIAVRLPAPLRARLRGTNHFGYFANAGVLDTIMQPATQPQDA